MNGGVAVVRLVDERVHELIEICFCPDRCPWCEQRAALAGEGGEGFGWYDDWLVRLWHKT